ncbi:MAG: hypothetical protein LBR35_02565, partial [Rickettsiales bacterium]|nr:hypothetical protein [Rickettsiales bacterium]
MKISWILSIVKFFIFAILPFIVILFTSPSDQTATGNSITNWMTEKVGCDLTQPGCSIIDSSTCIGCDILEGVFDTFATGADYALDFLLTFSIELLAIFLVLWTIFQSYKTILDADNPKQPEVYVKSIIKTLSKAVLIAAVLGAFTPSQTNIVKFGARVFITPIIKLGSYSSQQILSIPDGACDNYVPKNKDDGSVFSNEMKKDFLCFVSSTTLLMMGGMQGGGQMMSLGWSIKSFYTMLAGYWVFIAFLFLLASILFSLLDILLSLLIPVFVLPLLLVAWVFDRTKGFITNFAISAVKNAALYMVTISLSFVIVYSVYTHIGDKYFPAPVDNFSFIFPDYFNRVESRESSDAKKQYYECLGVIENSNLKGDDWTFQRNT